MQDADRGFFTSDRTPFPATGAWLPGMPVGERKFLTFAQDRPFSLDGGSALRDVAIAYETWGSLNSDRSNAVLVCHAWTGDSHVVGLPVEGHPTEGWWENVVGPGLGIDTNEFFVVCANVLGGCQGSTGPASPHPDDGKPYAMRFPVITIRDMVRAQTHLADALGIDAWHSVVGGSMGGMQVLEWAITFPHRVKSIVPIASCIESSAQQIAWGTIGRRAIIADPQWNNGDYYDAGPNGGPWRGLSIARMIAQVTFRTDNKFGEKFGRELVGANVHDDGLHMFDEFEVEGYLKHHGSKLIHRFDANSYLFIGKAMELHDVGRARGGVESAMDRINVPVLTIGIDSDILYPAYQQQTLHTLVADKDTRSRYVEIESIEGHDGFLIDGERVGREVRRFLQQVG